MPTRELQPYVEAMPVIQAQRALAAAEQVAVGMRTLPPAVHREVVTRWHRTVAAGAPRPAPLGPQELAVMARGSGIGFRVVAPKPRLVAP